MDEVESESLDSYSTSLTLRAENISRETELLGVICHDSER